MALQRAPLLPGTGARGPASVSAMAHTRSTAATSTGSLNGSSAYGSGSGVSSAVNGHAEAASSRAIEGNPSGEQDANGDGEEPQQPKANGAGPSRHGLDASEETLRELESRYFLYYSDVRLLAYLEAARLRPF